MKNWTFLRAIAAICSVLFLSTATTSLMVSPASAATFPGSEQTCRAKDGPSGTVKALYGGRALELSMPKANGYLPTRKRTTTRAYTSNGALLWTVDYRVNPSATATRYTFNRDLQVHRSGTVLVTSFHWDRVVGDFRCTAWSRIP